MFYKIALDGPSGAGKSTLAKMIAKRLGIVYVDTGAMYRSIGLFVLRRGVAPADEEAVCALLSEIRLSVRFDGGEQRIYLCDEDVTPYIRTPEISMAASRVSAIPAVRTFLLDTQRDLAKSASVIMDGRDIGTVIFPDAEVKIFLTASAEARAHRRTAELLEKGIATFFEEVLRDIEQRDKNDRERDVAPAVAAADATVLDNSLLDLAGTVEAALHIIEERLALCERA